MGSQFHGVDLFRLSDKAAEFLSIFILSNFMRYVSGYHTCMLDNIRMRHDPEAEHNSRKIQRNATAERYTVDKLKQICDLFGFTKKKKAQATKAELSESILAYFKVNESLSDTELFAPSSWRRRRRMLRRPG